jgi:hypothetical protein
MAMKKELSKTTFKGEELRLTVEECVVPKGPNKQTTYCLSNLDRKRKWLNEQAKQLRELKIKYKNNELSKSEQQSFEKSMIKYLEESVKYSKRVVLQDSAKKAKYNKRIESFENEKKNYLESYIKKLEKKLSKEKWHFQQSKGNYHAGYTNEEDWETDRKKYLERLSANLQRYKNKLEKKKL